MNNDEARKTFAKNLNYFLSLNGKKQIDLARYLDCGSGLVSMWCQGKKMPRVDKIQSIANWFHVDLSDLIDDKSDMQDGGYYLNDETKEIARTIYEDPDVKEMVKLYSELSPARRKACLQFIKQIVDSE